MSFFQSAIDVLKTLVTALGAGLGVWSAVNLPEAYGNDNPGAHALGGADELLQGPGGGNHFLQN